MSYSYFASDELARSLKSIIDDDEAHPCGGRANAYQNAVTTAGDHMLLEA